jgi:uncharacterized membrane protein YgaE (UPF0421/DUF939 family)
VESPFAREALVCCSFPLATIVVLLAIVMLVPKTDTAWLFAFHRFAEVSVGIAVALLLAWMWPESEVGSS